MRRARPEELAIPAIPAMTAQMTEAELRKWVPVRFDEITDPLATPEPSKGALIQLSTGSYIVVYWGYDSQQLTVEIPEDTREPSALLSDFLGEVPLPHSRILWRRPDIVLPQNRSIAAVKPATDDRQPTRARADASVSKRSARRVSLPKKVK